MERQIPTYFRRAGVIAADPRKLDSNTTQWPRLWKSPRRAVPWGSFPRHCLSSHWRPAEKSPLKYLAKTIAALAAFLHKAPEMLELGRPWVIPANPTHVHVRPL